MLSDTPRRSVRKPSEHVARRQRLQRDRSAQRETRIELRPSRRRPPQSAQRGAARRCECPDDDAARRRARRPRFPATRPESACAPPAPSSSDPGGSPVSTASRFIDCTSAGLQRRNRCARLLIVALRLLDIEPGREPRSCAPLRDVEHAALRFEILLGEREPRLRGAHVDIAQRDVAEQCHEHVAKVRFAGAELRIGGFERAALAAEQIELPARIQARAVDLVSAARQADVGIADAGLGAGAIPAGRSIERSARNRRPRCRAGHALRRRAHRPLWRSCCARGPDR